MQSEQCAGIGRNIANKPPAAQMLTRPYGAIVSLGDWDLFTTPQLHTLPPPALYTRADPTLSATFEAIRAIL